MRYRMTLAVLLLGLACINDVSEPRQLLFQYRITALGCDTPCTRPNRTTITSAARGDSVWIEHVIELVGTFDTIYTATVRPDCTENVAIELSDSVVATAPASVTCQDSTAQQVFSTFVPVIRQTLWPVDTALTPGFHVIVGRILVQPLTEPRLGFTVQ